MKNSSSILLAVILLLVNASAQADDSQKIEEDNDEPIMSQHDMNDNAAKEYNLVDDELNRLYKAKIAAIKTKKNKERFRDAQRSWIAFINKECLYEAGTQEESGSMWALGYFFCMERHTKRRIEDIKAHINCTEPECQN